MHGQHCLKTWSTTQNKVSLSSGEAEYYALVKCGCETLGLQSVMADLGILTICVMKTDSTAAKGITNRRGHGKVKHLQTCELWLQEVVRDKRIEIQKVGTRENPADLMTKYLDSKTATQHLDRLSAKTATGWHVLAPRLQCKSAKMELPTNVNAVVPVEREFEMSVSGREQLSDLDRATVRSKTGQR